MIKHLKYRQIDFKKYDACIEKSFHSRLFAFSWYLDIVAHKNWEVLIWDDYKAVMPLPIRTKYAIKYVYNPLWVLQLGIYTTDRTFNAALFITKALAIYKLLDLRLNTSNVIDGFEAHKTIQTTHHILMSNYDEIKSNFRKNRIYDLKTALKNKLYSKTNTPLNEFLDLYQQNLKERQSNVSSEDLKRVKKLIETCVAHHKGEIFSVYNTEDILVAAVFLLKHKNRLTTLISLRNSINKKNGANTFLIDQAIQKYKNEYDIFDFGGSSIPSIANYYLSLRATEENYDYMHHNNLPWLYKLFK